MVRLRGRRAVKTFRLLRPRRASERSRVQALSAFFEKYCPAAIPEVSAGHRAAALVRRARPRVKRGSLASVLQWLPQPPQGQARRSRSNCCLRK